jgi:hypothetical protein
MYVRMIDAVYVNMNDESRVFNRSTAAYVLTALTIQEVAESIVVAECVNYCS